MTNEIIRKLKNRLYSLKAMSKFFVTNEPPRALPVEVVEVSDALLSKVQKQFSLGSYHSVITELSALVDKDNNIYALLVRSCLKINEEDMALKYLREWKKLLGSIPSFEFYQISGEFLSTSYSNESISNFLLDELFFQPDDSLVPGSVPVLSNILFHHHEYNREVYLEILNNLKKRYKKIYTKRISDFSMCASTAALTFGLLAPKERKHLIERYFFKFKIKEH
ncbi:hypothetical protein [Vibrio sonorensis]|uniref:hypothetical protein n=1 Tax=Vibrio sonorensis TaxID=1004316 RepID=UPI0008DB0E2A|nr:hypothetical protein [Vibrio sonorensis]